MFIVKAEAAVYEIGRIFVPTTDWIVVNEVDNSTVASFPIDQKHIAEQFAAKMNNVTNTESVYRSVVKSVTAFRYGHDDIPSWVKPHIFDVKDRTLIIEQPKDNRNLCCGLEYVPSGSYCILTALGSFQVMEPDQFFRLFVERV